MSSRKLFNPIPSIITNSLKHPKPTSQISNPSPFSPKGPTLLATDLIKSYFQSNSPNLARKMFDEMPHRDVIAWTSMISGYTSSHLHSAAWSVFLDMLTACSDDVSILPNAFTFSCVLKACKGMRSVMCGAMVHRLAVKHGMEGDGYVENALMDMYGACCVGMEEARKVFDELREKSDVSWTCLITGYTHRGDGYRGLKVFRKMLLEGVEPNAFSFSIAIKACALIGSQNFGRQIHSAVIKYAYESHVPVMNSVLDMYCKVGCLPEAKQCFDETSQKDMITWNALISGYVESDPRESLSIYSSMELEGFSPNSFTLTSVTAACANLAVLNCGEQVHGGIIRRGFNKNLPLGNALIDMYAKCGSIADAHKIFSEMSDRGLISWTSMMLGYGDHGYGKEAVELFDEMVKSGIRPDRIVFMAVLSACSHAGLVAEGLRYFELMLNDYKVTPDKDTYGCVVDILCRAGKIEKAYDLIESMPFKPDESFWGALLSACRRQKIPHLSRLAAQRLIDLRPNMAGTYVMLSNFYAAEAKWGEYANMRMLMRGTGYKKEAGQSWIEVRNQVYSFVVGDKMGSHIKWVYGVLEFLILHMKEAEYSIDLDCSLHEH